VLHTASLTALLLTIAAMLGAQSAEAGAAAAPQFLLDPPNDDGPVAVEISLVLHGINEIDDERETVEFTGVLITTWRDPRIAFDPAAAGAEEKVYQGGYQFNEVATGWYPQVVLVNESGLFDSSGVVLRVRPDGTSQLLQTVNAIAEVELDMTRFPFDRQRFDLVFQVLDAPPDEVLLRPMPGTAHAPDLDDNIPQWSITDVTQTVRERFAPYVLGDGASPELVVSVHAERKSFFVRRLIVLPLVVIVMLSFSVFWMDRSSLGDRISVSFIGILTAVTYQLVLSDSLPRISYFTLMQGFLNVSFLTMCGTVVINLVVGAMDKRGMSAAGDRLDHRCRWAFPLIYFGVNGAMTVAVL